MSSLLRTKRLLWGIIFGLVTVMGWLSYVSGRRYLLAESWVEHTLEVQATINEVVSSTQGAESAGRGYLLTQDPKLLDASHAAQAPIPALLKRLAFLTRDNASQQERIKKLAALIESKLAFMHHSQRLSESGEPSKAVELMRSGRGISLMAQIQETAAAMGSEERRLLELRKRDAERAQTAAIWGIGLGSALTIALSLVSLVSVHRDVDELKRVADDLAESGEYFRLLTENSSDLVRMQDLNAKLLYVSPSVERLLGYTVKEFLSFSPLALVHPDDLELVAPDTLRPISERFQTAAVEYRIKHKDGSYRWLETSFGSLRNGAGEITGIQSSARDITERRQAEELLALQATQLRNLSLRDDLTGLCNRRGWLELSGQGLRLATRERRSAAVIFADLNGMKQINDQYGHEEGDRALRDTAELLRGACREVDVIARFGGDEFVIFALDTDEAGLAALRLRLRTATTELNLTGQRPFHLSMSLGAAFFTPDKAESIEELLDRADAAMYEQKRARKQQGGVSLAPPAPN